MDDFEKSDSEVPDEPTLTDQQPREKTDERPTFDVNFLSLARASKAALLRRLSESKLARRRAEALARLYIASPSTRSLCTLLCSLITLSTAMAEMFRGSLRTPWHSICLTFVGAAAYIIISCVILMSHFFGQKLPTFTVVMFSGTGGMLHLVAGSDAFQIKDFRWAALMSVTTGLLLLLDAAVTCLTIPWDQSRPMTIRPSELLIGPRELALQKRLSFRTFHPHGTTQMPAGAWDMEYSRSEDSKFQT